MNRLVLMRLLGYMTFSPSVVSVVSDELSLKLSKASQDDIDYM